MSHKPPLSKAERIPPTDDNNYRVTNGNIAVIDYGTTSVSLAYTTKGDNKVNTIVLDANERSTRVPNAILLKRENNEITTAAFGIMARTRCANMKKLEQEFIYFERIKMLMRREKSVNRETLVESFSGEKFYLVEVIAFVLQYLKDQLIGHFPISLKTTDFDWVITVPAIWDARGKRMMREAAYMAGLLTESLGIKSFTPISPDALPLPEEVNHDKLLLALEPESAALYSHASVVKQIEGNQSAAAISRPTDYMVIDIGGGTVDITAHAEVEGAVKVDNIPTGNESGGTQINEAFSKMLQNICNDENFTKFLAEGDRSQRMATLNTILYNEFEKQKVLFGQGNTDEIAIALPRLFTRFYKQLLETFAKIGIEYDKDINDTLYINKEVVEKELFGPAIEGIIDCTAAAIKENEFKVSTFYLVGGFGGCKYVHQKLSAAIEKLYASKDIKCNVIVPPAPQLAVATGAVIWRQNPGKIKTRRSEATYGIEISRPFDPEIHDEFYRFYHTEDETYRCSSIFSVFLEKGEQIQSNEVTYIEVLPCSEADVIMHIIIYCTTDLGVQYVKDKEGTLMVNEIGQLVIDIPNPDNLPDEKRCVQITMDFSGTEIQAKAKYLLTGNEVQTVCDFLSATH